MTIESSRKSFLALLALPLLLIGLALVAVGLLEIPKIVSRPIVFVAVILAALEVLRIVEALIRRYGREGSAAAQGNVSRGPDIWETLGHGFVELGFTGMCIYVLTCAACIVGFAVSISVQTSADAASSLLISQSESTLLAALSMAALMLEIRIAFIRHFGWPFD